MKHHLEINLVSQFRAKDVPKSNKQSHKHNIGRKTIAN